MIKVNSTRQLYEHVSAIARHFNRRLFEDALPAPLFTLKRGLGALGHFNASRWFAKDGEVVAEIALNPVLFGQHTWLQLMQTIAQQQCYLWQHCYGEPSRPGYHNAEWADKMECIGLMPSSTGQPGGRRTGQRMAAYPIAKGSFIRACVELASEELSAPLSVHWNEENSLSATPPIALHLPSKILRRLSSSVGAWSDDSSVLDERALKEQKRKLKYACPRCSLSVWGRPGLALLCSSCALALRETHPTAARIPSSRRQSVPSTR